MQLNFFIFTVFDFAKQKKDSNLQMNGPTDEARQGPFNADYFFPNRTSFTGLRGFLLGQKETHIAVQYGRR